MSEFATMPAGPLGNIYRRPSGLMLAGQQCIGHSHNFDHVTFVWDGMINVKVKWPNGHQVEQTFEKGEAFLVKAGCEHEFTAVQPSYEEAKAKYANLSKEDLLHIVASIKSAPARWDCVYAHRNPQGEVVQQNIGWHQAYG